METTRETTVLFAELIGAEDLYARTAEGGPEAVERCLAAVRNVAEACGGRMAKATRGKAMVLIATPDAAADAAVAMFAAVDAFPPVASVKLTLGAGFHYGAVIQRDDEVFGDTVNLAARLVEQAANGQLLTTEETGKMLAPLYRAWMRKLGGLAIKGREEEVGLCELVWRADENATAVSRKRSTEPLVRSVLRLKYRGKEIVRRRDKELVTIGRDPNCGIMITEAQASRTHCTIERRRDKFVLSDHSANGTWVTVEGEAEIALSREEFVLRKSGKITFGEPAASASEAVEFSVD